ncbi:DUF4430 domain-containing protein [Lactobacillus kefiranofaciens]|nr:Hypothetical protein WANG_1431 [Lactobacillus kefiranofaciens subsp. kefiranofaciens]
MSKKAKVMPGLKKAWKVQENKGFITAIDGNWTYTINGK